VTEQQKRNFEYARELIERIVANHREKAALFPHMYAEGSYFRGVLDGHEDSLKAFDGHPAWQEKSA
jgi:hypothetical protein